MLPQLYSLKTFKIKTPILNSPRHGMSHFPLKTKTFTFTFAKNCENSFLHGLKLKFKKKEKKKRERERKGGDRKNELESYGQREGMKEWKGEEE